MPDQIQTRRNLDQDQEIALLKHKIDDTDALAEELRQRVRKLERWVGGAAAVISAAITVIGIAIAALFAPRRSIMGAMLPPSRKSCYNFRVMRLIVLSMVILLMSPLILGLTYKKERVRVAGVDTAEKKNP